MISLNHMKHVKMSIFDLILQNDHFIWLKLIIAQQVVLLVVLLLLLFKDNKRLPVRDFNLNLTDVKATAFLTNLVTFKEIP